MFSHALCSDTGLNDSNQQAQAEALRDCMVHGVAVLKNTYVGKDLLQTHVVRNGIMKRMINTMYTAAIPRETITAVKPELLTQRVRDW